MGDNPEIHNWKNQKDQNEKSIGVIAQDVEMLFPQAVITNEESHKMVNYDVFGVLAIQAIKELNEKVKSQDVEFKREIHIQREKFERKLESQEIRFMNQIAELKKLINQIKPVATHPDLIN